MRGLLQNRLTSSLLRYGGARNFSIVSSVRCPVQGSSSGSSLETGNTPGELTLGKDVGVDTSPATTADADSREDGTPKASKASISKAMKSYMERAEAHHKFMKEEEEEFAFGRRHLANMMGKDPETLTQNDIEEAIRYLFPSSLSSRAARPMMKPPQEIYPKAKAAQFDASGRPHHPFFYTTKPNFYYIIYEVVEKMNVLNAITPNPSAIVKNDTTFSGTEWISKRELEQKMLENITDELYDEWVSCMSRLATHPNHEKEKEFILSYRKPLSGQLQKEAPPILLEPDGTQSVKIEICTKKTAVGSVTVIMPGSGKITINDKGLDYFSLMRAREAIIYPLQLVDWLGTVDVKATISGGGVMAQAAALRYGIATGIATLGADKETLRLAGLLTKDRRRKERAHQGCEGARALWTWKKR